MRTTVILPADGQPELCYPTPRLVVRIRFIPALALLFVARSAFGGDAQTAEALFQSGKEAVASGNLPAACARFAESLRLDPAVGTVINLADCEQRSGKTASALAHFQEAHDRLPPEDFRIGFVNERIAALGPRVAKLTVRGPSGTDTTIVRDEIVLGEAALGVALSVDPGPHKIVLRARGHSDVRQDVTLREGEERTVDLAVGPLADSASPPPEVAPSSPGFSRRTVGVVFGAAGLAGIGVGTVFGFISKSTYDDARRHCPRGPDFCDAEGVSGGRTAHGQAAASTIAFIAGGALTTAGLVLWLTAPHSVAIAPTAGKNQAGMELVGAW